MGEAPYPVERGGSNFASSSSYIASTSDLQYCTYDLQYIEDNKRSKENPWSVRHLGVYRHRDPLSNFDLWILLCPSPDGPVQRMLDALLQSNQDTLQDLCDDPFRLHVLLNHHYSCKMQWYLRALGEQIEDQEDEAFTLDIAPSTSTLNFEAIRSFRHLDSTLICARALCNNNLSISNALNTLQMAHDPIPFYSQRDQKIRGYLQGIGVLRGKISNSIAILSHGLDLKNGQMAAELNEHLLSLTRNTVDDSLTVKIITVVGLIYLPGDFVATLYGMNILPLDSLRQRLIIAKGFWIFVATWLPLTAITVGIYAALLWIQRRSVRQQRRHWSRDEAEVV